MPMAAEMLIAVWTQAIQFQCLRLRATSLERQVSSLTNTYRLSSICQTCTHLLDILFHQKLSLTICQERGHHPRTIASKNSHRDMKMITKNTGTTQVLFKFLRLRLFQDESSWEMCWTPSRTKLVASSRSPLTTYLQCHLKGRRAQKRGGQSHMQGLVKIENTVSTSFSKRRWGCHLTNIEERRSIGWIKP